MSAIVTRRFSYMQQGASTDRLENTEKLRLTVFRNADLEGVDREVNYIGDSLKDSVSVAGPWPAAEPLGPSAVARVLVDSRYDIDGSLGERPAALLHLACHSSSSDTSSQRHYINFGAGENGRVSIRQLQEEVEVSGQEAIRPRPLVFLNACATVNPEMHDRSSFAKFFMQHQSLGVLGTFCDISSAVASHFARYFYQQLFRGDTVGQALYAARWHLMEAHGNPLGLLYSFYGNADLRLTSPRSGNIVPACTGRHDV